MKPQPQKNVSQLAVLDTSDILEVWWMDMLFLLAMSCLETRLYNYWTYSPYWLHMTCTALGHIFFKVFHCERNVCKHDTTAKHHFRHTVYSSHQFVCEVTNQITNFKSPLFLFQVTKMCCIIQLQLQIWNVFRYWIIQHTLVTWNRKIRDLKSVIGLVAAPK